MTSSVTLRPFAHAWFCYFAAIGAFSLYAPLWFRDQGLSALAIGSIASLQSWTRVFAPYSWAWIADHTNRRRMLLRLPAHCRCCSPLRWRWRARTAWPRSPSAWCCCSSPMAP